MSVKIGNTHRRDELFTPLSRTVTLLRSIVRR